MMQKMKRGKASDYDFVEIMACPSGCVNGGGQIKVVGVLETPETSRQRVIGVETALTNCYETRRPEHSALVQYLYDSRRLAEPMSRKAQEILHTRYHAVPKLDLVAPLAMKW
jgi:iron only hydrogenase large subunit-like protein